MKTIYRFALTAALLIGIWPDSLHTQTPFTHAAFGSSPDAVKAAAKDVSNPQSWDETAFEVMNPTFVLFSQFKPAKCVYTYFKQRLYSLRCAFARERFEAIYTNLVVLRQVPKDREFSKGYKSATWYGAYIDGRFTDVLTIYQSGTETVVNYSDETQKDFRFADLFRGMTPWLILAIVGLFVGYLMFGWLMTSKCPKCKSRKLKVTGKSYDNPKDYDPGIFSRDVHWDEIYHYKCANCGFEKDDVYSSFWSWRRGHND